MLIKLLDILKQKGKRENGSCPLFLTCHILEYVVDILSMGSNCQLREPDTPHKKPDQAHCVWRQSDDNVFRRVDLVVVPYDDYSISLLNWTGSSHFERSVRLYAKQVMSIKVSPHGFYSQTTGRKLAIASERHAFEMLGLRWLEPEERDC